MFFKLDWYYNKTKFKYVFVDVLMTINDADKDKLLHDLGISYSSFRVEKSRDCVRNDNVERLLSYYYVNPVGDRVRYENCINNLYYAIYFKDTNSIKLYLDEINNYIDEYNFLKPIFVLFKIFGLMNLGGNIYEIKECTKSDLMYICNFKKGFFLDEFELLYEAVMLSFNVKDDYTKIANLSLKYDKLNWIYLSTKGSCLYLNGKDNEALRCYKELLDEFEKTHNNERLMSTYSNIGFLYNALNEYTLCIKTLQNALYNVFSPSDSIWISNIVLNYVFACFMISKYAEIINLVTNNLFQYKRLNWVSASIFILACFFFDDFSKASNVISYFKDDENVNAILKYLKTNDLKCLDLIKTTQFSLKIIEKLKCL